MTKFSILSCAVFALVVLSLVEASYIASDETKPHEKVEHKKDDTKHKAIKYDIISANTVSEYFPHPVLFESKTDSMMSEGYTFIEWVQIIGKISPDCILAPVRTLKELFIIKSMAWKRVYNDAFLVGVWKDQNLALDCQKFGKGCLSGWKTFVGHPVPEKQDFWTVRSGHVNEPDGKDVMPEVEYTALASVANLAGEYPTLEDSSVQRKWTHAAIMCVLDEHSMFHIPSIAQLVPKNTTA